MHTPYSSNNAYRLYNVHTHTHMHTHTICVKVVNDDHCTPIQAHLSEADRTEAQEKMYCSDTYVI